jgi:undecaprenyl-phosphate 4-deoxy-4-formamido-L-arabinose transferase
MKSKNIPTLSLVIPMKNEADNINPLFQRLFPVLRGLGLAFEVICIDDGSTDETLEKLLQHQQAYPELTVLAFSRNFGQHAAVMAGFEQARGQWIITMDADLQNPPEEIPKLVAAFQEGYDLVGTYREGRQDPFFRKFASDMVNRLTRKISGVFLKDFGCMLRGYSCTIAKQLARQKEYRIFIPALATLYAKNPVEIPVSHAPRTEGVSNYSFMKLLSLQLDLMTSLSLAPLRLLFLLGSAIAIFGISFGFLLIILRLILGPAWAAQGIFTLFAVLFILIGGQFIAFGLLGEYIGRIFQEVRGHPTYVIRNVFPENPSTPSGGSEMDSSDIPSVSST